MTDTPRTLPEILELFDDNGVQAITAQDLRDFVVSLTSPIAGGGFDRIGGGGTGVFSVGFDVNWPTGYDVPDVVATPIPLYQGSPSDIESGLFYDPEGWFRPDDTYDSTDWYGYVLDAGTWLEVPPGLYLGCAYVVWDTNTTGYRSAFVMETADNRVPDTDPRLDPFGWDPVYQSPTTTGRSAAASAIPNFGTFLGQQFWSFTRIPEATGPQAIGICSAYQNSGGTRKLLGGNAQLIRLGPAD